MEAGRAWVRHLENCWVVEIVGLGVERVECEAFVGGFVAFGGFVETVFVEIEGIVGELVVGGIAEIERIVEEIVVGFVVVVVVVVVVGFVAEIAFVVGIAFVAETAFVEEIVAFVEGIVAVVQIVEEMIGMFVV
jgi:hypothetical protein